jgi:hypothetical protein
VVRGANGGAQFFAVLRPGQMNTRKIADRRRGRPKLEPDGMVATTVNLTRVQQIHLRKLGGSAWLRVVIAQAIRSMVGEDKNND